MRHVVRENVRGNISLHACNVISVSTFLALSPLFFPAILLSLVGQVEDAEALSLIGGQV